MLLRCGINPPPRVRPVRPEASRDGGARLIGRPSHGPQQVIPAERKAIAVLTRATGRGRYVTSNASRRIVGQWGGAGGAICEDHLVFAVSFLVRFKLDLKNPIFQLTKTRLLYRRPRECGNTHQHLTAAPCPPSSSWQTSSCRATG